MIEFDAEFMIPVNIYTHSFDLTLANSLGTPTWGLLHDYVSYYSLPDMRSDNLYAYATKVFNDEATAIIYKWNRNR